MKDRYLFKAKRVDNGEWIEGVPINEKHIFVYGDLLEASWLSCSGFAVDENCVEIHEVIPETICACTGLKDKNGELIFEGDKVRYETGQPDRPHIEEEVYWGDGAFYPVCTMPSKEFEIIGNIHDKE